ncbi:MAG TPA: tetratricopeptide repeat protein [Candidatus Binatia bacterium]|nr:tetratricopeptide repeat protein [Candidatus Binatia bacterium]
MEKPITIPQIVASLAVLALYYWSLFLHPVTLEAVAPEPGSLTVEESRELLDESRTLLREREFARANEITLRLHEAYPQNHVYLLQLAAIARELRDPTKEAEYLEKFVLASPTPIEACPRIGQAYAEAGRDAESLRAFERCLAFDPKDPDSLLWLARAYEGEGRFAEAEELYRRGLDVSPTYADLRIGIGRAHLRLRKLALAREDLAEIQKRWPDNTDGLLLGALVLRADGRLEEAKRLLERGVEKSPEYPDFYVVLGSIAELENRPDEALAYYDKALELRPGSEDAAARRARLARR